MVSNSPTLIEVKDIRAIAITKLAEEAMLDGFCFLQRMIDEWRNGLNTFSKPGEKLWALLLMHKIIQEALGQFTSLRLFTENPAAAVLYEAMGFRKTAGYKVTHLLAL